jgi:hypothetical protein
MGTRSVVAIPQGDSWKGRFVHWDGYPAGVGSALGELVERDGLEKVIATIVTGKNYSWSSLKVDQIDLTKVKGVRANAPYGRYEYGTPEYSAWEFKRSYGDGRFKCVVGYGIAHTDTEFTTPPLGTPEKPYRQTQEDFWITPTDDTDTEWAYVLTEVGVAVLERQYPNGYGSGEWVHVGLVRYGEGFRDAMAAIEKTCAEAAEARYAAKGN